MSRLDAVIIDLEGALANIDHRLHHINGEKKDWESFFEGMNHDSLNGWCARLCAGFQMTGHTVIFITGRPIKWFEATVSWLDANGIDLRMSVLYMRKDEDFRPDVEIKREIYETMILPTYEVHLVIEDRKPVVEMWRSIGLPCLHCAGDVGP